MLNKAIQNQIHGLLLHQKEDTAIVVNGQWWAECKTFAYQLQHSDRIRLGLTQDTLKTWARSQPSSYDDLDAPNQNIAPVHYCRISKQWYFRDTSRTTFWFQNKDHAIETYLNYAAQGLI